MHFLEKENSAEITSAKKAKAVAITTATALMIVFVACTSSNSGFNTGISGQVNKLLESKPMPLEINLNQISYMSCPAASATTATNPDPLQNPFYRIRFGAYDNSTNNGFSTANNVAGIGLSKSAMDYMRTISASPNTTMLTNYIKTSPYTADASPVAALIYRSRNSNALSANPMTTPFLAALNNSTLIYSLVTQPQLTNSGTQKTGYFSSLNSTDGTIFGSLNQSQGTELQLRQSLASQFLFIGFTPSSATSDSTLTIQNLVGPDKTSTGLSDPTKRLFGNGYSISFGGNNYISQNGIAEYDLSKNLSPTINPQASGTAWSCFNLTVVRDVDRKYYTVNTKTQVSGNGYAVTDASITMNSPYSLNTIAPQWNKWMTIPASAPQGYQPTAPTTTNPWCPSSPYSQAGITYTTYPYSPLPNPDVCLSVPNSLVSGQLAYLPQDAVVDPRQVNTAIQTYGLLTPNITKAGSGTSANGIRMNYFSASTSTIAGTTRNTDIDDTISQLAATYSSGDHTALNLGSSRGGNFYACPPEHPATMTTSQLEQLRIVRRFLSPDLWEVNISQGCAVPTRTTNSIGSCYNSGDTDISKIIQYDGVDGISCGTSATGQTLSECAAKISFCWRTQ